MSARQQVDVSAFDKLPRIDVQAAQQRVRDLDTGGCWFALFEYDFQLDEVPQRLYLIEVDSRATGEIHAAPLAHAPALPIRQRQRVAHRLRRMRRGDDVERLLGPGLVRALIEDQLTGIGRKGTQFQPPVGTVEERIVLQDLDRSTVRKLRGPELKSGRVGDPRLDFDVAWHASMQRALKAQGTTRRRPLAPPAHIAARPRAAAGALRRARLRWLSPARRSRPCCGNAPRLSA